MAPSGFPAFPPQLGDVFEPLAVLGEGGHGVVYRARRRKDGVEMALKVLSPTASREAAARFVQEAEILLGLDHAGICRLLDSGRGEDRLWLAMELLEGETLRERLRREGRFTAAQQVLELVRQMAAALEYAHGRGVLHRDVKPENLFLERTPEGERVKLLDFGLGKAYHGSGSSVRTQQGLILGTPSYMAPERVRGEAATPATDVYALAVIAYEMLGGKPPFSGDPIEVMRRTLRDDPPPLPDFVPPEIAEAVLAGLAKDMTRRVTRPREFALGLRDAAKAALGRIRSLSASAAGEASPLASSRAGVEPEGTRLRQSALKKGEGREPRPGGPPGAAPGGPGPGGQAIPGAAPGDPQGVPAAPAEASPQPRATKRLIRDRALPALSRAMTRITLLSPQVRPFVLGGSAVLCLVWIGVRLGWFHGAEAPPRVELGMTVGITGVELAVRAEEAGSLTLVVLPSGAAPPRLPDQPTASLAERARAEFAGLKPDTDYVVWGGRPAGTAFELARFRTAARIEITGVEIMAGAPARLRVTASLPWSGEFEPKTIDAPPASAQVLRLPAMTRSLPRLLARTAGGSVAPMRGLATALAHAVADGLDPECGSELARRLVRAMEIQRLDSGALPAAASDETVRRELAATPWYSWFRPIRPWLGSILEDPELEGPVRLRLAGRLAALAVVDGLLLAAGRGDLGEDGRFSRPVWSVYRSVTLPTSFKSSDPPGPPWYGFWLPEERNNLYFREMAPGMREQLLEGIRIFYPFEKEPWDSYEADVELPPGDADGVEQVAVVIRASHPETVVFVEVNRVAVLPVTFGPEDKAVRGAFGNPTVAHSFSADLVAPLQTRRFDLPAGTLRPGRNRVRVWAENLVPRPDPWLPTLHGVLLKRTSR